MSWHLDQEMALSYAQGLMSGARAASLEAHVLACDSCRALLAPAAPAQRLGVIWEAVLERVDEPSPTPVERLMRRVGIRYEDARLLAAAPSLQASWLLSLTAVLAFAAIAAQNTERGSVLFLILAPLVPVAAVAGSYGQLVDPTYEITRSSPYSTYRLLILRVVAVLVMSVSLVGALALTLPEVWLAAAWLLPCLAMVGLMLTLNRWLDLAVTALLVGASYLVAVAYSLSVTSDADDLFSEPVQVVCAAVAAVCLLVIVTPSRKAGSFRRML